MKNRIVLYFSGTGNNRFLAEKIAEELGADLRPLQPRFKNTGLVYLLSLLKWRSRIRITAADIQPYHEVIVVGPIYGGLLLAPLREAIRLCANMQRTVHFATCCGLSDEDKYHRYGYAQVLDAADEAGKGYVKTTAAFPVGLAFPEDADQSDDKLMEVRLSDDNYAGRMQRRVRSFARKVRSGAAQAAEAGK